MLMAAIDMKAVLIVAASLALLAFGVYILLHGKKYTDPDDGDDMCSGACACCTKFDACEKPKGSNQ